MCCAIQLFQPLFRISQAQTLLEHILGCPMTEKARSVVSDLNTKRAISAFGTYFDETGSGARCDSMANCILDDWLEDEVGYSRIQCVFGNVQACNQAILKTDAFDFQVAAQEGHLLFECDFLRTGVFQSQP